MKGAVAWVGRSSMEIRMEVIQPVQGMMMPFRGLLNPKAEISFTDQKILLIVLVFQTSGVLMVSFAHNCMDSKHTQAT
jgi:hypothetical protein